MALTTSLNQGYLIDSEVFDSTRARRRLSGFAWPEDFGQANTVHGLDV
jgi:hypothetical protein